MSSPNSSAASNANGIEGSRTSGPLAGLRVVELGDFISGPFCAHLLMGLGADVVKVEPPSGDRSRRYGPFRDGQHDPDASGLYTFLNTGKGDVQLDVATDQGRSALAELVASADVFVENLDIEAWRNSKLDYEWFRSRNPSVVVTSISPFGRRGPHANFKGFGLQAAAGAAFLQRTGDPERYPLCLPLNNTEFNAGAHAAAATLVALTYRDAGGSGQWIDLSMQHCELTATSGSVVASVVYGTQGLPRRGRNRVNTYYPYTVLPVADGYMSFITTQDRQWRAFLDAIGNPDWSKDPRFANRVEMVRYGDELDSRMIETVGRMTREEIWSLCRARRIAFQPVHRIDEVVKSDHMASRNWFRTIPDGTGKPVLIPGAPYHFKESPPGIPEPSSELDVSPGLRSRRASVQQPATPSVPLGGTRVLDFGQVWAGPLLGCYLADFGADVIRIQSHSGAAIQPSLGGAAGAVRGDARSFDSLTRNRRNLSLNLQNPGGRKILSRLVARSDVVINNFSPAGAKKLGLDYESLRGINPEIIVAALSASGAFGPWSDLVTYGPSLSALYGIKSLLGYPGGSMGLEDGAHLDPTAATFGCVAVLAALRRQRQTGEGVFIDLAQGEAGLVGFAEAILEYGMTGQAPAPRGNRHRLMAPSGVYPVAGEDAWISISVDSEQSWRALTDVLGASKLAEDDRYSSQASRQRHHDALDKDLARLTLAFDGWQLTSLLQDQGVAAYPVLDVYGALNDPQLEFRKAFAEVHASQVRPQDLSTITPWLFTATPPVVRTPTSEVGAQNAEILSEVLGMSSEEILEAEALGALS